MLWKLRLFWDRLELGAIGFFAVATLVVGSLAAAMLGVFADRDARAGLTEKTRAKSEKCLAEAVYFEARGEPLAGQYAVAEVTMNRRGWGPFRKSVCAVVYAPGAFSWTSQRRLPQPSGKAWDIARTVAENVYWQKRAPTLPGARYYHATYVSPDWAKEHQRLAKIGRHIFYRWRGSAGEARAFTQRYAGREPYINEASYKVNRLARPEAPATTYATLKAATTTVKAEDGTTRVAVTIGGPMAGRRKPTKDQIAQINASLAKFEHPADAPAAAPAPVQSAPAAAASISPQ